MGNRINLIELLKDCPKGMELDCTIYDKVTLAEAYNREDIIFPIRVLRKDGISLTLTKYGQCTDEEFAKCVIFPKGKDTWEGFQRPAKDGDVVVCEDQKNIVQMFVVQSEHREGRGECYFGYNFENNSFFEKGIWEWNRLATEEEKQKLFKAIKDNFYKWNAATKTLEKIKTCLNCKTFEVMHQNCPYSPIWNCSDLNKAKSRLSEEANCEFWNEISETKTLEKLIKPNK